MKDCFTKKQPFFPLTFLFVLALALSAAPGYAQTTVDCSISTNCSDAYCNFAANIEKGCRCYDGVDNDGDGKIDKADSNCATYYGLVFVGDGSNCSIVPPGAADPFDLVNVPITSAQNTADTQSKVSVGDIDGDGIPDAVITSKWNSEIRVVATRSPQADGTAAGKVKSDFNLSGAEANAMFANAPNNGPCKPNRLLFEHENLIADINKDGKAELFGVVSNRGGNPQTPPTCFYLVGFKYAPADLVPLFNAVPIGTDRPGTFGIADMDGDGKAEIYLRDRIYAAETGALLASAGGNWDLDVTSAPVAVNISGDSKMELVCGTKIYSIPSLTNRNPAAPAGMTLLHDMNAISADDCYVKLMLDPVEYGEDTHSSCSVADIDRDGNVDVVISGALNGVHGKTSVFYWNVAKNTVSHFEPTDGTDPNGWVWGTGRVNLGDANGDGKTDFSFIAGNRLWCLTTNASGALVPLWANFRTINDSRSGVLTVTIYDFNNDGKPEMVYRDSQILAVIDGTTGTQLQWSAVCQSHTYTEGPVIADVNGDGGTDICVTCNTSNSFDINDGLQQQALGQFRLYYSSGNEWLPTRKVWNQPGYFVVNIKDNLQLPFPQLDQNVIFGPGSCPNGLPGPQMPMNVFLNQVPFLNANGCAVFPAPDLSYIGDNPDNPGVDINGDGVYTPAVEVVPPICGDLAIKVRFNIVNDGDLPISSNIPVSFFKADPTLATTTASDLLYTTNIAVTNLGVDQTLTTPFVTFNGTGGTFRLYIVLNNNGSVLPINLSTPSATECRIDNNIYSVNITPDPFITKIEKIQDNVKCIDAAPNTGEVRVRIFKGTVEQTDYSPYAFQWFTGPATSPVIINGATNYNLTNLVEGDYTAQVTNTLKGCTGILVDTTILRTVLVPSVSIVATDQTSCSPFNGTLTATVAGGNTGFTFEWRDNSLALVATGSFVGNLKAGDYKLDVIKSGCRVPFDAPTILPPAIPDAQAQVLLHVEDCLNPNSGSVTADAYMSGVLQDPANYTFDWYFYNNATGVRGSILPPANGTGKTRTGLPVGFYQVEITNNTTQCKDVSFPVEVTSQTILPSVVASEVQPVTSCDPTKPNGILTAVATATGLVSPNDFTFEWFEGDNTLPANLRTTVSGLKGETLNNVRGGGTYYTVKVTTARNCSATNKIIISENIIVPVVTLDSINNGICNPALATSNYNGSVISEVTFGGPTNVVTDFTNYTFTWHQGSLATDPVTGGNTPSITELNGGIYTLVVERTDLFCKANPVSIQVLNAQVFPTISTAATPSTNCAGGTANGAVAVTGVVPADTYSYRWFDPANALIVGQTGTTLANRQGGAGQDYTVEVTLNSTGCRSTLATNIPDNKVNPILTLTPSDNSICDAALGYNGAITSIFTDTNAQPGHTYAYVWSTGSDMNAPIAGQTSSSLTQRNGGFYTATIRNSTLNCTSSPVTTQVLNNQILPAIATTPTPSTNCPGGTHNGAIVASVTNGLAGQTFAFEWHKGNLLTDPAVAASASTTTSSTISAQQGNQNYIVEARNNQTGCENTLIQTIADNSEVPVLTLASTDNSICDATLGYNGTASQNTLIDPNTIAGDTYAFVWSTGSDMNAPIAGQTASTLAGRNGGFYTATVRNVRLNCISNAVTVEIKNNQILPAIATTPTPSTNCPGGTHNGAIIASVTNGLAGQTFAFEWHKGNLLTDPAVAASASTTTSSTISAQQGNQNYIVEARNNQTGCENTLIQTIADNSEVPVLTLVSTDNSICDATLGYNGTASQNTLIDPNTIAGDTYAFVWSTGNDMNAPIAGQTASTLAGRNGGFYTATVRNVRLNCISNAVTVEIKNNQILPAIATTPTPSTNCPGGTHNGAIVASVTNGLAGQTFAFEWHKGNLLTDPAVAASASTTTSSTISAQQGNQNYIVEAKNDQTGCENTLIQTIVDNSEVPVLTLASTDNSICDATLGYNGTASQNTLIDPNTVAGDTYAFVWSTGNDMNAPIAGQTASTLAGRNGGFYTATVRNVRLNCISNAVTVEIKNNQILPAIATTPTPSTNCPGGADNGEVTASITNALAAQTFTFEWHKGNLITDPAVAASASTSTTSTISAQQGGSNYFVQAINDGTGCKSSFVQPLADISTLPAFTLTVVDNQKCIAPFDGSLTVSGLTDANSAGTDTYTAKWYDGAVVIPGSESQINNSVPQATLGAGSIRSARDNGFYTVVITNERLNCTSSPVTGEVLDNLTLPVITTAITPSTNCSGGDPNGAVNVTGVAPADTYEYRWYSGLMAVGATINAGTADTDITGLQGGASANYTIEVTRTSTGCTNTATVNIADDSQIPVISPLAHTDNTNCTAPFNGTASVNAVTPFTYRGSTGMSPYTGFTLTWTGGGTPNATGDANTLLAAGTYTLTVTANNNTVTGNNDNCISSPVSVTIVDDLTYPVVASTILNDQTSCDPGQPNGQIEAVETSGMGAYSFNWYKGVGIGAVGTELPETVDGTTTPVLESDNYTVLVTNTSTRCVITQTTFLPDNITLPTLILTQTTAVTNCAAPNGVVTATPTLTSAADGDFTFYFLKQNTTNAAIIKTGFQSDDDADLVRPSLGPGFYAALVRDEITHCESQGVTVQVMDNTNPADITITAITKATFCNSGSDGAIDIAIAGGAGPFTYRWHRGGPTNAGPYDYINDENGTTLPTFNPDVVPFPITTEDMVNVAAGFYTIELVDSRGCGTIFSESVPFQNAPRLGISKANSTQCDVTNGDGSITTEIVGFSNYSVNVYLGQDIATATSINGSVEFGNDGFDNDGDGFIDGADADFDAGGAPLCTDGIDNDLDGSIDANDTDCDAGLDPLCSNGSDDDGDGFIDGADPDCDGAFTSLDFSTASLEPGDYLIEITDHNTANCKIYKTATIKVDALSPIITLGTITPNTACPGAVATFADGSVEITIDKDPLDATVLPPVFRITSITAATPTPATNAALFPLPVAQGTPTVLFTDTGVSPYDFNGGFGPQTYQISVVETNSGCTSDQFVTIPDQPNVPQLINVVATNDSFCAPNSNGQVLVTAVNPVDIEHYVYRWYTDAGLTTLIYQANGTDPGAGAPFGGQLLDATKYPAWMNATGLGIGTREYYVRGERLPNTGPGAGCPTPAVKVVVQDEHVTPVTTLSSLPNTSCTPGFGEGRVRVETVTNSTVPAVQAANYDYVLSKGAFNASLPNQSGALATLFSGLEHDAVTPYTLVATNGISGCQTQGTVMLQAAKFSIAITNTAFTNQMICNADGDIAVTQIVIDRSLTGEPDYTFPADGTLENNFEFEWFKGPVADFAADPTLQDNTSATIDRAVLEPGAGAGQYAAMGAGTYYVVAKRTSEAGGLAPVVGLGCETVPVRVDIEDQHKNPVVTLARFSDTSCTNPLTGPFEGEIEVRVTDATIGIPALVTPYVFDYTWTTTPNPIAPSASNSGNGINDGPGPDSDHLTGLENGDYVVRVTNPQTGCFTDASTTILKNVTPIFVTATSIVPQFYCDPSGRITVTQISYEDRNGAPQTAPLADFDFDWTRVGVGIVGNNTALLDSMAYGAIGAAQYSIVATRTANGPGRGCISAPVVVEILNKTEKPVITLTPFSNTSCTTVFEGEIEVDITDASAAKVPPVAFNYNYTWTAVNPVALALPTVSNNAQNGVNNVYPAPADPLPGLQEGVYRLTALNTVTGCTSFASTEIIKNQTPVFVTDVDMEPQFYCDASGNLDVKVITYNDRDGVNQNGPLNDFVYTWSRSTIGNVVATVDATLAQPAGYTGTELDSTIYNAIGADIYFVTATRKNGVPGAGCSSAPFRVDITDEREYPVISLTPFSNTSCTTVFEGEIEVDITDASAAKVPPAAFNYNYTWTAVSPATLSLPTVNNNAQNGVNNVYPAPADPLPGLQEGVYRLTALNTVTGCSSFASTEIIKNQTPVFVTDVDMVPQFYCDASGNLDVKIITYNDRDGVNQNGPLDDFVYTWSRSTIGNVVATVDATVAQPAGYTGTELDSTIYNAIGADIYFVTATRKNGIPGAGCSSAPFRVDIADEREYPTVSFTTVANTACDNNFDGRITVLSSNAKAPGTGSNYNIAWTVIPAGNVLAPANNVGSSYTTPLADVIGTGSFTARVTNIETQCYTDAVVMMISNPEPLEILTVNANDQMICDPDGSITVTTLNLGGPANYTYRWHRANAATPDTFDPSVPLRDDAAFGNDIITTATLTGDLVAADGEYSAMGAGSYYIIATKNPNPGSGSPGSGCPTPPFRKDVQDLHIDPTVSFTHTPNTSCSAVNPNGTVVATAEEPDGTNTGPYTFTWSLGGTVPGGQSTPNNFTGRLDNAADGVYEVVVENTATGCTITSGLTVEKNLNLSLPNIIDVNSLDPNDCKPNAFARVMEITIGGHTTYSDPNLDPLFDFTWYKEEYAPAKVIAGETNAALLNILPDRYFVLVKDVSTYCESTPKEVVIESNNVYPVVVITQNKPQASCVPGMGTAELSATADGSNDITAYNFSWYPNLTATPPSFTVGSVNTVSNLIAGEYSVSVQNVTTECLATQLYIVPDEAPRFMPILSVTSEPRANCLVPDGMLFAREVGFDPNVYKFPSNYTVEYYHGENADVSVSGIAMPDALDPASGNPLPRAWVTNGLDILTYTVKITDHNTGCVVTQNKAVGDGRVYPEVVIVQDNPLVNCDITRPNGQLSATADNGRVGGYDFQWYRGETAGAGDVLSDINILIGQSDGTYTVRVTNDFTGCPTDAQGMIEFKPVYPPIPTALVVQNRTHCEYPDGWVTANVDGETFNHFFDWYDGATAEGSPDFRGPDYTKRDVGPYTVRAMDVVTGCYSDPVTVPVGDERLIPELVFTTTPSFCEDVPSEVSMTGSGSIELQLVPANALTDSVAWINLQDNTIAGEGAYITGLYPGFYQADVRTVKGCTASGTTEVKTEVLAYNLVTRNGDQKNDKFVVDCISRFPNNTVKIFNRSGVMVYEAVGYNNNDVVFQGFGENGIYTTGNELPVGTYFYIIDKRDGSKPKTGYLELVK